MQNTNILSLKTHITDNIVMDITHHVMQTSRILVFLSSMDLLSRSINSARKLQNCVDCLRTVPTNTEVFLSGL